MALFCSQSPILSVQIQRYSEIPKPIGLQTLISSKFLSKFSGKSISAPPSSLNTNSFLPRLHCCTSSSSSSSIETDESHTIIFIKGLPQSTSEGSLKKAFSQFGEVNRVKIITDKKSKQPLGFAYIWFSSVESAQIAVAEMNGKFYEGRFVLVTIARPGSCKSHVRAAPYKF